MASDELRPNVGVLAEYFPGERRVALVPADVRRLIKLATVTIERGAVVDGCRNPRSNGGRAR
jgi:alanine dehydrogenase